MSLPLNVLQLHLQTRGLHDHSCAHPLQIRRVPYVFIRDRKGRRVQEVAGKDDKMRVFLRQCEYHPVSRFTVLSLPCSREQRHHASSRWSNIWPFKASTLKGYLNKYMNVARGYSTRWFVLKDGVLSCMSLFSFPGRRLFKL